MSFLRSQSIKSLTVKSRSVTAHTINATSGTFSDDVSARRLIARHVDSGSMTVTGATALNTLNVSGNELVAGALNVIGPLTAAGIYSRNSITAGTLNVTGPGAFNSIVATALQLPTGAIAGDILTTDAFGNVSWQPPVLIPTDAFIHLTGTSDQIVTGFGLPHATTISVPTMAQATMITVPDPGVADSSFLLADGPVGGQVVNGVWTFTGSHTTVTNLIDDGLTANSPVRTNGAKQLVNGSTSLTTEVTGVLPVANGGTNSGTALVNGRIMVSNAGAVVEGALSSTAPTFTGLVTGGSFSTTGTATVGQLVDTGLTASLPVKTNAGQQLITGAINLASATEVTGILAVANGGTGTNTAPTGFGSEFTNVPQATAAGDNTVVWPNTVQNNAVVATTMASAGTWTFNTTGFCAITIGINDNGLLVGVNADRLIKIAVNGVTSATKTGSFTWTTVTTTGVAFFQYSTILWVPNTTDSYSIVWSTGLAAAIVNCHLGIGKF